MFKGHKVSGRVFGLLVRSTRRTNFSLGVQVCRTISYCVGGAEAVCSSLRCSTLRGSYFKAVRRTVCRRTRGGLPSDTKCEVMGSRISVTLPIHIG